MRRTLILFSLCLVFLFSCSHGEKVSGKSFDLSRIVHGVLAAVKFGNENIQTHMENHMNMVVEVSLQPSMEPSMEPSVEEELYGTPEFSMKPLNRRSYPCRSNFTLTKEYKQYPYYKYVCLKPNRLDAIMNPARCPSNYVLNENNLKCLKTSQNCLYYPRPSNCFAPICYKGELMKLNRQMICVICPKGYTMFLSMGIYRCFNILRQTPVCPSGQKFSNYSGKCKPDV